MRARRLTTHARGWGRPSWIEFSQPDPDDRPPDPRQLPLPLPPPQSEGRPASTERPSNLAPVANSPAEDKT